jgi:glucose-1-phosphate thymidylyltransferase
MKAIIPVAGAGTRLRPHTYTQPKPLIPVAGKTIIAFNIEALQSAGIKDFVFIIGYMGDKIKDYVLLNYPNINATFVVQEQRDGLGHAIWTARDSFSKEEEILIVLGDIIFETDLKKVIANPHSSIGVRKVSDPRSFGVVEMLEDCSWIKKVVEKPRIPRSDLAIVGIYKIKEITQLIDCLDFNIKNNIRSVEEIQLTDAIQKMLEEGCKINTFTVDIWFDCGKKEILLETNQVLLERNAAEYVNTPSFETAVIVHPVSIGDGCQITNSIIGPYVTIGQNTIIDTSIVKNSIIGSYSTINEASLQNSVIGSDSSIKGPLQSLNIGDNTEIDLS